MKTELTEAERIVAHTVAVGDTHYTYDAYSNRILKLDSAEHAFLKELAAGHGDKQTTGSLVSQPQGADREAALASFRAAAHDRDVLQPIPMRDVGPPPSPDSIAHRLEHHLSNLTLEVTRDCNFRCRYCLFTDPLNVIRDHEPRVMTLSTAKKAVEFFLPRTDHSGDRLSFSFYGGEPLLAYRTIASIIDYVNEFVAPRTATFHLTTNGAALNKRSVRALLAENNVSVLVSIDGPRRLHDAFRHTREGGPTFRMIEAGLATLLREYPGYYRKSIRFSAVLTSPKYYEEVVDFFNKWPLAQAAQPRAVRFNNVDVYGDVEALKRLLDAAPAPAPPRTSGPSPRIAFVENRVTSATPSDGMHDYHGSWMVRIAQRPIGTLPPRIEPSGYCLPGTRKLFVSIDGTLEMCEKTTGTIGIGSLKGGFDIPRIHALLEELHALWTTTCSHCIAQRFCGTCPAMSGSTTGTISSERFRDHCQSQRRAFVQALDDFVRICDANPAYFEHLQQISVS